MNVLLAIDRFRLDTAGQWWALLGGRLVPLPAMRDASGFVRLILELRAMR